MRPAKQHGGARGGLQLDAAHIRMPPKRLREPSKHIVQFEIRRLGVEISQYITQTLPECAVFKNRIRYER